MSAPLLLLVAIVSIVSIVAGGFAALGFLAAVLMVVALRPEPRAPAPAPAVLPQERIDAEVLTRLLVLRVFLVARRADWRNENKLRSVSVIRLEDPALRDTNAPTDVVMRGLFYALVLEELDRRGGYTSKRRPARKLGLRLGEQDPYPLYLRMVEAAPADEAQAAAVLGVTAEELERHRRFLRELPVQRWR